MTGGGASSSRPVSPQAPHLQKPSLSRSSSLPSSVGTRGLSGTCSLPPVHDSTRGLAASLTRIVSHQVPESIRREFHLYSGKTAGPMGLDNIQKVTKQYKFQQYIDLAEHRSVVLDQLVDIHNFALRHRHSWQVELAVLNLYEVNKWIIMPATIETRSAMAEHLPGAKKPPIWFISHWWGEQVAHFLKCVRQHLAVRDLANSTAYWVCAYANRQHGLEADLHNDPKQASFFKAMVLARFKVLLIVNSSSNPQGPAIALTRIWCTFECTMSLDRTSATVDVAAWCDDRVEMLTSGLNLSETNINQYSPGQGYAAKIQREASFPMDIVNAGLKLNVLHAASSVREDRTRILNCIIGNDLDSEPPSQHDKLSELNCRLRCFYTLLCWHRAVCATPTYGERNRESYLVNLKKLAAAIHCDTTRTSLRLTLAGAPLHDNELLGIVMECISPRLDTLVLKLEHTSISNASLKVIAEKIPRTIPTLSIDVSGCAEVTDKGMADFFQRLPKKMKVTVPPQYASQPEGASPTRAVDDIASPKSPTRSSVASPARNLADRSSVAPVIAREDAVQALYLGMPFKGGSVRDIMPYMDKFVVTHSEDGMETAKIYEISKQTVEEVNDNGVLVRRKLVCTEKYYAWRSVE